LYSQEIDAKTLDKFEEGSTSKISLTGTFGTNMPADSHNSGVYLYCDSPLGSSAVYTERFGGRHDLAAMLRGQEEAFNLLWDIVLLQLDALAGDAADYTALRSFLDTTMRADMWDLLLEMTVSDLGKDSMSNLSWQEDIPDDSTEMFMRALHFLHARGYLEMQEMLAIVAGEFDDDTWVFAVKTVGTAIGRRMAMADGAMPAAFETLMDYPEGQFGEVVERVIEGDERIAARLAEFRESLDGMSAAEASSSVDELVKQTFLFDFDLLDIGGDARDVTLYIDVEPYMTNGAWYEASEPVESDNEDIVTGNSMSYVEWQYPLASIAPRGDLAQVVFAFWAKPAEEFQLEHFGIPVLSDKSLANQCRWRQLLGPALRDEWDAFVAGLRPGPDLENALREFRFSIEDPTDDSVDPKAIESVIAYDVVKSMMSSLQRPQPQD
jgi:hypothetical protein